MELLLRDLSVPSLRDIEFVCASATVGRTLRRQLMQILDAPSADAAATLVTCEGDARAKSKDKGRRRNALLPEGLAHAYRVVPSGEGEGEEEERDGAYGSEEERVVRTLDALWDAMAAMEEATPVIVFPGRVGAGHVEMALEALDLEDVRRLRSLDGAPGRTPPGGGRPPRLRHRRAVRAQPRTARRQGRGHAVPAVRGVRFDDGGLSSLYGSAGTTGTTTRDRRMCLGEGLPEPQREQVPGHTLQRREHAGHGAPGVCELHGWPLPPGREPPGIGQVCFKQGGGQGRAV